jgi:hypothetical protein
MKTIQYIFLTATLIIISSFAYAQNAKEIVTKAEDNIKGLSSVTEMTILIKRPTWTRSMSMKGWTKGEQYSMIVVTAPAKDAGTVFLKRVKEIWNWLPNIERVVKLPPSMMSQSWMGTDLTNDDLVKASSRIDDYNHKIVGDSVIEGRKCWKIEMIPWHPQPLYGARLTCGLTKRITWNCALNFLMKIIS